MESYKFYSQGAGVGQRDGIDSKIDIISGTMGNSNK